VVLLALHAALAVNSLVRENPTIDEVIHLPAGLTYWQTGTFKLYHHNPPLIKLVAALPLLNARVQMQEAYNSVYWDGASPNKAGFAHVFAEKNADRYFELFTQARLLMPLFSILGGAVVFVWSRTLYGNAGGLLSLALWVLCPNVLAHARLVTTDVGATAIGTLATYVFWRYLKSPTWIWATAAGLALGLAELSKFSMILLYALWPFLWLVHEAAHWERQGWLRRTGRALVQGLWIVVLSVVVIDAGYGFEGVGQPLGRFEFYSATLTRPVELPRSLIRSNNELHDLARQHRVNRFQGSSLAGIPSPLPRHYLLGFDDQKLEADGIPQNWAGQNTANKGSAATVGYPVYLDGELRDHGWWYFYFAAIAYKVPEGTLALVGLSLVVLVVSRRSRAPWADEITLLAVPVVVLLVMSFATDINLGLRYVLPTFPFMFISAGKLVPWAWGLVRRSSRVAAEIVVIVCLLETAVATALIHPHYLAYFNWASGGPSRGSEHLIDSSLDWGQDLVNLRLWLKANAPGERVGLAYFGQINPNIFAMRHEGFDWFLPPIRPGTMKLLPPGHQPGGPFERPTPGLYAVSASLVRGLPWRVYDRSRWEPYDARKHAFSYFQDLTPIKQVGYSIFIYRLSEADANRLAPLWLGPAPEAPAVRQNNPGNG
jgi:4-amino-4-deoxy-L-arabinose transferase-like glycosyltransferase